MQAPCVRPRALHESGNLGRERKFSGPCADTACSRTGAGHGQRERRPREERPRIPPALDRNAQCTARAAPGRAVLRVPSAASPYPRRPRPQNECQGMRSTGLQTPTWGTLVRRAFRRTEAG